jgi:hypothetical protein
MNNEQSGTAESGSGREWECPWCGANARNKTSIILLDSRACDCGAVAIAGPRIDSDEIIDAAIDHFHVTTRPESCGYDAMFLQDIQRSGIEIREGCVTQDPQALAPWGPVRHLWFRRMKTGDHGQ